MNANLVAGVGGVNADLMAAVGLGITQIQWLGGSECRFSGWSEGEWMQI